MLMEDLSAPVHLVTKEKHVNVWKRPLIIHKIVKQSPGRSKYDFFNLKKEENRTFFDRI